MKLPSKKQTIILVILISVAMNVFTFCVAYPQTFTPEFPFLARDFSAYYLGEWRLFHSPTKIYYNGYVPGDYQIIPRPQVFKYTPSFLVLFVPILTFSYQNALNAFDLVQVALIPFLAFFVYKLVKDKNLFFGSIVAIIILINPLPILQIAPETINSLGFRWTVPTFQSFSPSYFCGYTVANAHILQTVLLVGAAYFGFTKKPWFSALLLTLGSFDPRGAFLALPLLLWYNRRSVFKFLVGVTVFLAALNLPFFFYYGVGFAFSKAVMSGYIVSQMYLYDWIPLYSIAALIIVEIITVVRSRMNSRSLRERSNFNRGSRLIPSSSSEFSRFGN